MSVWLSSYTLALGGIFLVWLAVSADVVIARAPFDTADLSFQTARLSLDPRLNTPRGPVRCSYVESGSLRSRCVRVAVLGGGSLRVGFLPLALNERPHESVE
jgi:hypothetical protein